MNRLQPARGHRCALAITPTQPASSKAAPLPLSAEPSSSLQRRLPIARLGEPPTQRCLPLAGELEDRAAFERSRADEEALPTDQLFIRVDNEKVRPATSAEIIFAARRAMTRRVHRGTSLGSARAVQEFLALKLGMLEHEVFAVLLLDTRHRLLEYVELFRGTIDGASVHPREVVKLALARNAAALVLAHPHPSGSPEPSVADELITRRLTEALALVDIRVLDHVIVAGGEIVSFAERGLL